MNLVLVFPLILALISCGQSHTKAIEQTNDSCYNLCPAGYYKVGHCDDRVKKYKCKKCEDGTFTDVENYIEKCLRCDPCNHDEVVIERCTFNRSTVCGCKEGYYNSGSDNTQQQCSKCSCINCPQTADYTAKCQPPSTTTPPTIPSLSTTPVVNKRSMPTTVIPASTLAPAPSEAPVSTSKAFMKPSDPHITEIPHNSGNSAVLLAVLSFVLLSWFLLICAMRIFNHNDSSSCWNKSKDAEVSQNEQPSHQGSNPTTLTLTLSEETPMLTLSQSPAISEHPTHISPLVPVNGQIVARQNDHADRWPAIVLYAIIKEVPLHRWKEFLRLLKVADQQMARVELETGFSLGSMEKQYQMLRLWSQRSSSKLSDVFSALHYMELSGCAQLLQESLEQLQWTPDHRQALTAL